MSKLLEEMMRFFNDEENLKKFEESLNQKNAFQKLYIEKIDKLGAKKRYNILQKIIQKYNSDAYIQREYRLGYIPRESLYDIILLYAQNKGKIINYYDDNFASESYLIDDNIIVSAIYGQGTKILIHFQKKHI